MKAPSPPYVPAKYHGSADNKPINRIVLHSTVSACVPGGAEAIAEYFQHPVRPSSAHYVVDPGETRQCVFDSYVAFHAPPNEHSIGIEMCDTPGPVPGDKPGTAAFKAARRAWRWRLKDQQRMLARAAHLTARLCVVYDVPPMFLGPADLVIGKRGITTHNNVSSAFHQSTHWDPGFWPKRRFMKLVRQEVRRLHEKETG